ncbi:hypothetical protein FEM48_Zijuj12G0122200 [Ziziphus jujuba var. spinosa]|uniref:Uncharacterized protein n=1 Tax=Ziziphus jujuba var. spinosa TaxID=714518 RepID=A0A978UD94_ZIZJJ|nr:hypothetical protein FEM48_Zijuj12G0122200 [Ziziphus jujuba var. spinosa]
MKCTVLTIRSFKPDSAPDLRCAVRMVLELLLHGCCIEGNHLLLVYEFMENNSFTGALLGNEENLNQPDRLTRKKMYLGVAKECEMSWLSLKSSYIVATKIRNLGIYIPVEKSIACLNVFPWAFASLGILI